MQFFNKRHLSADHRDVRFFRQEIRDTFDCLAQLGETGVRAQHGELKTEHEYVELFGFDIRIDVFGRQAGDLFDQLAALFEIERLPGFGFGVVLDKTPLRADDEVVEVHGGNPGAQMFGQRQNAIRCNGRAV